MRSEGAGVNGTRIHILGQWRIVYVAKLSNAIYVLHDFQKGSQKTNKNDIGLCHQNGSWQAVTMERTLIQLDVRTRAGWRRWLTKHHASSPGVWLLRHKQHTGVTSMSYEDLVREALCFGWIDSLVKRLDEDLYAIKVTPRQPRSKWSDPNRKRWKDLQAAGLLAVPGLRAAPNTNRYAPKPRVPELPAYIVAAFKADREAWAFFQTLSARNRRNFVVWIHAAKRPETRERHIRKAIELLSAGKKLGLK